METSRKFIIILSSVLLAFFMIALACLGYNNSESFLYVIIIAQLVVFSLAACSVILFYAMSSSRKTGEMVLAEENDTDLFMDMDVTKLVLLSESNSPTEEFSLLGRMSAMISKENTVYLSSEDDFTVYDYAVLNLVEKYWYVERMYEKRSVMLKRAGEQNVYKLKTGVCYKLQSNDILYIDNERLLVV